MKKLVIALALVLGCASWAWGKVYEVECQFSDVATYENEKGKTKLKTGKEKLLTKFIIDTSNSKAYMVGNNTTVEVSYLSSSRSLSFIESTPSGNLTTTTIFIDDDGECTAVHSRHIELMGAVLASQFYGICRIR